MNGFEVGAKVRHKTHGTTGTVVFVHESSLRYLVEFDMRDGRRMSRFLAPEDLEAQR